MKLSLSAISASLFAVLFFTTGASAAIQCYQCHGTSSPVDYRPIDSAYRNLTTGGFKGNHRTHMGSNATPSNCTPCHGNSGYMSDHRNGKINMASTINSSPGSSYSKGVFFNQTSVPVSGTCSSVNCHFERTTPAWGIAAFTSPNDCDKCHGAPPSGGVTGAAGSHAKHDTYYTGAANCGKCHSDHAAEANKFIHATSAGKRNLVVSFAAAPNNGSGVYSGALNDYLPSQTQGYGTCTNLYCHSRGNKAMGNYSVNTVPTWGTPLPANCTGCHRADSTSGSIMKSGSHGKHVDGVFNAISCGKCHAATVGVNGMTIIDPTAHVNAKVNIKFNSLSTAVGGIYGGQATPYAKNPGTAYGQCNNVYCHSTVQSGATGTGAPTYRTPTWGNAGTGSCGTCHDGDNGHVFSSAMSTGSHTAHLSKTYGLNSETIKCSICHNIGGLTISPGQACDTAFCHGAASVKHSNGKIEVLINPYFGATGTYNGSQIPRAGFSTCSNIGCHFNTTTPLWGTATTINCFGCHTYAQLAASGAHAKHISGSFTPTMYNFTSNKSTSTEYNFGCANCHPVAIGSHWNGSINVTLKKNDAGVGTLRSKNSAMGAGINGVNSGITGTTKTNVICSAAYCHSNGNAAALVYAVTPNWYGGTFANSDRCANCHGNSPNSTIAGSKSHYNNRMLGYTSNPGGHVVGIHALSIYSSPRGLAKAGTTGKSSHGNPATSTAIGCNICHYETVNSARNDDNIHCRDCHFAGNTVGAQTGNKASISDKSKHVNGLVNVSFKPVKVISKAQSRQKYFVTHTYSSVWTRSGGYKLSGSHDVAKEQLNTATMWNSATKTCSNIACHMGNSVKWNDNDGVTECVSCHGSL